MATTAKNLFLPPRFVPGEGMSEVVQHSVLHAVSERVTDANLAVGVNAIFNIPKKTYIHDIRVHVVEAFDQSMSATLGDGDDPDRFMDDTAFGPGSTGWKSVLQDAQPGSFGYVYDSADTLDLTRAGGTPTTGSADIHLFYIPRADEAGIS